LAAFAIPSLAFSAPIEVELLTPLATGVFANGGIAPALASSTSMTIQDGRDELARLPNRPRWLGRTGLAHGGGPGSKPYIGSNGALWLIGNDFDNGPPQRYIPRIDTFEPQTGAPLDRCT
jgi:hypothetical protein